MAGMRQMVVTVVAIVAYLRGMLMMMQRRKRQHADKHSQQQPGRKNPSAIYIHFRDKGTKNLIKRGQRMLVFFAEREDFIQ